MFARTYITYVAVAALALVAMTSAAPAAPGSGIATLAAVAEEMDGPDFLPVPKEMFPMCCHYKVDACCFSAQ
ncbi:MAG: hypothetical protein JOS17DRAFT_761057 [Linnemannia elongata]|nr:MAG: hypothetical protein JOS17DRAFT_761057 [Linnemannia elongata]